MICPDRQTWRSCTLLISRAVSQKMPLSPPPEFQVKYTPNFHWFRQFRLPTHFSTFWMIFGSRKQTQTRKTELSELSLQISQSLIIYLYFSLFLAENIGISLPLFKDVRPRMRLYLFLVCNVGPHTLTPLFYCEVQHYICRSTHAAWKERCYAQFVSNKTRSFCAATIKKSFSSGAKISTRGKFWICTTLGFISYKSYAYLRILKISKISPADVASNFSGWNFR